MQDNNDVVLKRELDGLLHYLNLVRSEIAAIGHPADEEHGLIELAIDLMRLLMQQQMQQTRS